MATRKYEGWKFEVGLVHKTHDPLPLEAVLQININGKPFTATMRTPGDDYNLVRGLLHSEDILVDTNYFPESFLGKGKNGNIEKVIDLSIPEGKLGNGIANSKSLLSVSSCGICGRTELEDLSPGANVLEDNRKIDPRVVSGFFQKMYAMQDTFLQSGGTHAAAAFTTKGEMLCIMEDIGRHNAVDKVIGNLILAKKLPHASCMIVSGRISYEIVIKCFRAKIPVLAAVSAPSTLAVDYAKELGITIFAYCRDKRATCFSHPDRIAIPQQNRKTG